jgi:CSLREA domain-containing protein
MKRPTLLRSIIATVLLFLAPQLAIATTRTVTNLNDSGTGSLRDTIAASGSGDTINFAVTGTIVLTSASLSVNHNLTIQGPGADNLNITRQSTSDFRIFFFDNGTWTLSDVTISNGSDSVTSGGIYNFNGNLTLTNCVVSGNSGGQRAGGIGNDATTTMNNCTLINNQSGGPGGVGGGGGIFNGGTGTLTLHNCTLSNNSSATNGGGILTQGTLTVTTSTFNDNTGGSGGAIDMVMAPGQDSTIQNCTFSHNTGAGTIRHAGDATLTVQSCTFTGNNVGAAASIYVFTGAAVLRIGNTILDDVPSLFLRRGAITSLGYNLSRDDGGGFLTATGDQTNTDPELDPFGLQYNGGFTDTIALIYGSPAIDAGKSFGLTTDQRGQIRPYDNPNFANVSGSDGSDIGAYEAPSDPLGRTTGFIVTTTADHDDGMCGAADCTLREAIARANSVSTNLPRPISFGFGVTGTITVQSELVITAPLTISGPGARVLAISGGSNQRVLHATGGGTTIFGLTIRDGHYDPAQNHGETRQGGAVFNQADLTFTDCAFINNAIAGASNITNGGNGGSGQGGAIFNAQNLYLYRCTFYDNSAFGAAGTAFVGSGTAGPGGNGGSGQGGAIFNNTSSSLLIQNCTFNTNTATGGAGGAGSGALFAAGGDGTGGAIFNLAGASGTAGGISVFATTISGNNGVGGLGAGSRFSHGPNGGSNGGIFAASTTQNNRVGSAIIAGNSAVNGDAAPDAEGPFSSAGFNLIGIGDQSSGWRTDFSDQVGTTAAAINPQLGPLQNNGGPTNTMAPLTGSPAIDQGYSFGLFTDQRGYQRPFDDPYVSNASDGSDIGAFELKLVLPTSAVSRKTHGSVGPFDITLPLSGTSGIECRSGGVTGDHQLIVTFPSPVTINGSPQAQVTTGTGQVGSAGSSNGGVATVTGGVVSVPLTNVSNAQRIAVTLFRVSDGINTNDVIIPMSVLAGDTTANGSVNSSDIAQTQSQSGQPVTSSNFREDVTVNGSINSSDIAFVQSKSGTALPAGTSQSEDPTTTAPRHRGSPGKSF